MHSRAEADALKSEHPNNEQEKSAFWPAYSAGSSDATGLTAAFFEPLPVLLLLPLPLLLALKGLSDFAAVLRGASRSGFLPGV